MAVAELCARRVLVVIVVGVGRGGLGYQMANRVVLGRDVLGQEGCDGLFGMFGV